MLEYASKGLRDDRDVVMEAVRKCGYAGDFASDELRCEMAACWLERMEQEAKND